MRTIQYNVYTFDELNEETQKRAIEKCTDHIVELLCEDINASYQPAIKSLEQATKTKLLNWEIDAYNRVRFTVICDYGRFMGEPDPEEITGKLLFREINRSIIDNFIKGKYYGKFKQLKEPIDGKDYQLITRHSKVIKNCEWPITGTWVEDKFEKCLLDYYHHWNKYSKITLQELMEDCWQAFFNSWTNDLENCYTTNEIKEHIIANEYEFLEDGTPN